MGVLLGRVAGVSQRNSDIRGLAAGTMYQTAWKHFHILVAAITTEEGAVCLPAPS